MSALLDLSLLAVSIGSALIGGVFFAFSTFVMRALARQPAPAAIATMQSINVTVINPWFLGAFLGTALACVPVVGLALSDADGIQRAYLLAGGALYLLGCFGVTIARNVPLNDRLAAVDAGTPEAGALWEHYLSRWTLWNHVRTAASLLAAAMFTLAMGAGA